MNWTVFKEAILQYCERRSVAFYNLFFIALQHFPSVAVRDGSGSLIAYEVMHHYGGMGVLHVHPDHRSKGLAKYVTTKLARHLLDKGDDAFCFIEADNPGSATLHDKCGMTPARNTAWCVYIPSGDFSSSKSAWLPESLKTLGKA